MNTLAYTRQNWEEHQTIPCELTRGQLEEVRDCLCKSEDSTLVEALERAIAERPTQAA